MDEPIPIPLEIEHVFGEKRPDTRIYERTGTQAEYRVWTDAVFLVCKGGAVSPGGASMFGGKARASVHNRMEDGKLTAFIFKIQKGSKTGLGESREKPYIYVPVSEIKAWAEEIKEREFKKGEATPAEVEPPKTGWVQDFLAWKKKMQKKGGWHELWIF
jgi:ribosomal protein L21